MIYAKVDVKLRDHERAARAGAAMSTWLWALLYTREQELDGFVPDVSLRGSWVGDKEARKHAAVLVTVGLWLVADGGWRVARYEAKNETVATIAARRAEARTRMGRSRSVRANIERTNDEPPSTDLVSVPGSGSVSSGSRSLGDRDNLIGHHGAEAPPWWPGACDGAEAALLGAIKVDDRSARWAEYLASRDRKRWAPGHRDAVGWLTNVLRAERERGRARGGASRHVQSAENREWIVPKEMP